MNAYEQRCKELDKQGYNLIFGNKDIEDADVMNEEGISEENNELSSDEDENDYIAKDTIRKHQFDHNRHTCLTNNYPEMFIDQNGKSIERKGQLEFAPAEGNYPTNLINETDWDIKSWPALHADGKYGLHFKRKIRLTEQQYFAQRILNRDLRFSKSPGYIFAAAAYIEQKQLSSKENVSFMRGKKTVGKDGTN